MILHFSGTSVFDNRNDFLNYLLYFNDFRNLDDLFNYLLNVNRHLDNFLDYLLDLDYLFKNYFNFLILGLNMINDPLNFDHLLHLNNFISEDLDLYDLWNLFLKFYKFLDYCRHLHNSLNLTFKGYEFFDLCLNNERLFYRNINYLIDLLNPFKFNNLFDYLLYGDDLWHFNYPLDYLLDDLLHLNNFWCYSEYFQDIINIHHIHYLGSDHPNNSFIHLESSSCSYLDLL